jgi:hypothetical protein
MPRFWPPDPADATAQLRVLIGRMAFRVLQIWSHLYVARLYSIPVQKSKPKPLLAQGSRAERSRERSPLA